MNKWVLALLFLWLDFLVSPSLSAQKSAQIQESQRNYNNCLHGYAGCDSSQLTDTERTQVQQAARQRNYNNCLHGYAGCDSSQLTDTEQTQVQQAARQRNYNNCLHGYAGCDSSQLTDTEQTQVRQAARQRNYNNCLHGYAGCDSSQLTDTEQTQVRQAARQRNYNNCLHGYYGCNPSLLTDSEKESVAQSRSTSPTAKSQPPRSTAQNTTPRYYTNKDGQRVQAPTHSDTIPAGATAQCRDGTYSFSRNHRGTCSHHGGVSRWLD
jgi:uncharacterized protein DUF3761